jgi:hypothetical protein
MNSQEKHIHDVEALNALIFQPFELNDSEEANDLDPDSNYYNPLNNQNITGCKYFYVDQLNHSTSSKNQIQFSNLSFDIRSLPKNFRQFVPFIESLNIHFHTISLTETWLQDHNHDLYEIEGYHHVQQLRKDKKGGGYQFM